MIVGDYQFGKEGRCLHDWQFFVYFKLNNYEITHGVSKQKKIMNTTKIALSNQKFIRLWKTCHLASKSSDGLHIAYQCAYIECPKIDTKDTV